MLFSDIELEQLVESALCEKLECADDTEFCFDVDVVDCHVNRLWEDEASCLFEENHDMWSWYPTVN